MAEWAQGKLKSKKEALRHALVGRLTQVQRWGLGEFLARVEELAAALQRVEIRIGEEVEHCPDPFGLCRKVYELYHILKCVSVKNTTNCI